MSCKIYCIEDWHNLKYVGSTTQTLIQRLSKHKANKKHTGKCSSSQLDLDNCEIELLEICPIERRSQVEQYWISRIDCVNIYSLDFESKKYEKMRYIRDKEKRTALSRQYKLKNKEQWKIYDQQYRIKNREKLKEYDKQKYKYKSSWGGDSRWNNNLLLISTDIFSYNIS